MRNLFVPLASVPPFSLCLRAAIFCTKPCYYGSGDNNPRIPAPVPLVLAISFSGRGSGLILISPIGTLARTPRLRLHYASQITKGQLSVLQVAQNVALHKICGVFKTTPVEPLPYMSTILPMAVHVPRALALFEDRLSRLPPNCLLRTLPHSNAVALWRLSLEPRTCITRIAPSTSFFPPFSFPAHPALHQWSHPRLRDTSSLKPDETGRIDFQRQINTPLHDVFRIYIHPIPIPSPFCFHWCLYKGNWLIKEGTTLNEKRDVAMAQALLASLMYDTFFHSILIYLPASADSISMFRLHKHANLFYAHLITHRLNSFLQMDAVNAVTMRHFSPKWSCAPRKDHRESELQRIQPLYFPTPPNPRPASQKATALVALGDLWEKTDRSHGAMSRIPRPGTDTFLPPPFLIGVNTRNKYHHHRHRQLYTAGTRCFTGHDFTAGYCRDSLLYEQWATTRDLSWMRLMKRRRCVTVMRSKLRRMKARM